MISNLPLIVDIKRHSLEDGPGIRSVVFFKGCPLHCIFCHNPETQKPELEIAFSARECIQCGECVKSCHRRAIDLAIPGRIHRDQCDLCGNCASVCPGKGLRPIGCYYPVEKLADLLLRDYPFYRHSGGGVTLSGGECTLYPDYLQSLLGLLKARAVHVALETSGEFDFGSFEKKILPYIDLIYYDLKIVDPLIHRKVTGRSNTRILDNLRRLFSVSPEKIHARVPVVPGITTTQENLVGIADFLYEAEVDRVSLLPYNPLGIEMHAFLGKPKPCLPEGFMTPKQDAELHILFRKIIADKANARRQISVIPRFVGVARTGSTTE